MTKLDDDELDEVLNQAIPLLPPRCRLTLIMVSEGASYEDIAAKLKVETKTAIRLYERAIEFLCERYSAAKQTEGPTDG